jgi:hypothetical protein
VEQRKLKMAMNPLILQFQKNLLSIAEDLDQIRLTTAKDIHILSINIGRIQGMANGLDWYISQQHTDGKDLTPAVGFDLKRIVVQEEDEEPHHEEEEDKNKVPQWGRRKVRKLPS